MTDNLQDLREKIKRGDITESQTNKLMMEFIIEHLDELTSKVDQILEHQEKINGRIGDIESQTIIIWAKKNPKLFLTIFIFLLILSNLWFVSGFREAALLAAGIPPEIIKVLTP